MSTMEENNLICIFAGESRNEVIADIERDTDMAELSGRVIRKLRDMADGEFELLELIKEE